MRKDIELFAKVDGKEVRIITNAEAATISGKTVQHVRAATVSGAIDGGTILDNPRIKNRGVGVVIVNEKFKKWCQGEIKSSKPKSMKELTKNFDEFMKGKEENPTGGEDFDDLLGDVLGKG